MKEFEKIITKGNDHHSGESRLSLFVVGKRRMEK